MGEFGLKNVRGSLSGGERYVSVCSYGRGKGHDCVKEEEIEICIMITGTGYAR